MKKRILEAWKDVPVVYDDFILDEYKSNQDAIDVNSWISLGLSIADFGDDVRSEIDDAFLYVNDEVLPYLIGAHILEIEEKYDVRNECDNQWCFNPDPGEYHYMWFISSDRFLTGFSRLSAEQKWITYVITKNYFDLIKEYAAAAPNRYPEEFIANTTENLHQAIRMEWRTIENRKWE